MDNNKDKDLQNSKILDSKKEDKLVKNKNSKNEKNIKNNTQEKRILELENILSEMKLKERDKFLRAQAEIENIKRRNMQEMEKVRKFALENFILDLLPVIDNLERALISSNKNDKNLLPIIEGIELTLNSFIKTLMKFGIEIIKDIDVQFNPDIHQAINVVESDKHKNNQVIEVVQKGYKLNDRLIRPAMVVVTRCIQLKN